MTLRHWLLLPVVAAAVIMGSTTARGYWSSAGDGDGSAGTSIPTSVALGPGTNSQELFPGGTSDVAVSVTNSNPFAVHIETLELGPEGFSVDLEHSTCSTEVLTFTVQSNGGSGWTVPAGTVGGSLHLSNAVAMTVEAPAACQGAVFDVDLVGTP
jgi:hypothetical protein